MQRADIWLTPEQAASISGRSMIAIRALVQATTEDDGTRHLLQLRTGADGEPAYLLHRSLVSSEGLGTVTPDDVVEILSRRIEELEAENGVLRLRSSSMRHDTPPALEAPQAVVPRAAASMGAVGREGQADSTPSAAFWLILGGIIVITLVIIVYILVKQGVLGGLSN